MAILERRRDHLTGSGLLPMGQCVTVKCHGDPRQYEGSLGSVGVVAEGIGRHWVVSW
ncbi:hypothetical protein DPMN_152301 [Dreissena polymorpha]|uniref:Uncharacterized protein n=1 Tax=Dreissena polymorpha TaxID=45954 RepID=A0A9D4FGL1_DREPO|nr:hypothetical protein DPMN_152301 [Dreissena polymorpha]